MISLFLSLILIILLSHFIVNKVKLIKLASKIPGHNGIPFVGIITEFFGVDNEKIFEIMQKYTKWPNDMPIAKLWLGPELIIVVNSPECIQTIFNSVDCLERPNFYDFIDLKKGLLFGRVDIWKSHRKILNRAFTLQKLKSFVPHFNKKLNFFVRNLENCTGVDIDILSLVSSCFLEIFLMTTMEYDEGNSMNNELLDVHDRIIENITNRMSKVWLHSNIVNSVLKVFQRRRKIYVNELLKYVDKIRANIKVCCFNVNVNDIMESKSDDHEDYLCEDDKSERKKLESLIEILENPKYGLSDDEIEEELMTVILAAQDTTSLILSTSILMLAMHKDVQQKAFNEVKRLSEFNDLSYDIIARLEYIEMIIKETLRLFPVDHMTLRTASADIVLNGIKIPRDSKLVIPVFNVHRNQYIWGNDATSFRPERFAFDDFKNIHPYAFIPFTGGSRICLGRKYAMLFMKTCLAKLLLNYELDTKLNFNDITLKFSITLKLAEDYVIKIKKRQV